MPSFDVVSEIDMHELSNAVDQANREVDTRFDFKGSESRFEQKDSEIVMESGAEFQLQQMLEILRLKMTKRGIDIGCIEIKDTEGAGKRMRLTLVVRQGIDKDSARNLVKKIKESKLKVQAAIQGEQVRVTGKKRDDLQSVMQLLRDTDQGIPVQFTNFRD